MKRLTTITALTILAGCGGSQAPSAVNNAPLTTQISNAQAFLVGNGLGGLSMQHTGFTSLFASASQTKLYQVDANDEVKAVVFKKGDEVIPTTVEKSRRAGKNTLAVEVTQAGEAKTLLINSGNGEIIEAKGYQAEFAQVRGTNAFLFRKDNSTKLYQVDLAGQVDDNGELPAVEAATVDALNSFKADDAPRSAVSNGAAFLIDDNGNVIAPDNSLLTCGINCRLSYFYNANGVAHQLKIEYDNSPDHHITATLYTLEMVNGALQATQIATDTQHFANTVNVAMISVETPYSIHESRRNLRFDPGFYRTEEAQDGTVSLTWTDQDWSTFTTFLSQDNGFDYLFAPICDDNLCAKVSGDYIYWQSFNFLHVAPWAIGTTKVLRMKFDGSSSPEVVVEDATLESFDVAGETVIYTTANGTFSISTAQPEEVAGADLQVEQIVEMEVQ